MKINKENFHQYDKQMSKLIIDDQSIDIPDELELCVENAIEKGQDMRFQSQYHRSYKNRIMKLSCSFLFICIFLLNVSPTFAKTMHALPVVGEVFQFLTFREYHFEDETYYINVNMPHLVNTSNTQLEERVNKEIQCFINKEVKDSKAEARDYFEIFMETGGAKEDFTPITVTINYEKYMMSKSIISFSISRYETHFNAYNKKRFYNIDLETGKHFTVKDYLGNNYKKIISDSIEKEIDNWSQEEKAYLWNDLNWDAIINENMPFYINSKGTVVVVFEKYEIGQGAAGELIFPIYNYNDKGILK